MANGDNQYVILNEESFVPVFSKLYRLQTK